MDYREVYVRLIDIWRENFDPERMGVDDIFIDFARFIFVEIKKCFKEVRWIVRFTPSSL